MISRIPGSSCAARKLLTRDPVSSIPTFLCPAVLRPGIFELPLRQLVLPNRHRQAIRQSVRLHTDVQSKPSQTEVSRPKLLLLPVSCPGCGAFAQNMDPNEAGFYSATRKAVKTFAAASRRAGNSRKTLEDGVYKAALHNLDGTLLSELGLDGLSVQGKIIGMNEVWRFCTRLTEP
jgi:genetic interactor of prohibitins 3, mitochondrial